MRYIHASKLVMLIRRCILVVLADIPSVLFNASTELEQSCDILHGDKSVKESFRRRRVGKNVNQVHNVI